MEVVSEEDLKAELNRMASAPEDHREVLLENNFRVWKSGQNGKDYGVRLTPVSLLLAPIKNGKHENSLPGLCCICPPGCCRCCLPRGPEIEIFSKDIVVCRPSQGHQDTTAFLKKNMAKKVHPEKVGHPVFMILAYPITKSNGKRSRQSLFFHYMPSEGEGSSRKKRGSEASRVRDTWIHAIFTTFFTGSDDQQLPVDVWTNGPSQVPQSSVQRRLLVILNPKSGKGKATRVMHEKVGPAFKDGGLEYEVLLTERVNHAREVMASEPYPTKRWKGVVTVSGDGSLHEVINGIFDRPDWRHVFSHLPVGVVPAGSGNAMSRSLIFAQEEPFDGSGIDSSILNVIRGNSHKLDLFHIETKSVDEVDAIDSNDDDESEANHQPSGEQRIGFLSIAYGIIADVDIESEHLRGMGDLRFTVYGLLNIAKLRTYKAKVWYLPKDKRALVKTGTDLEIMEDLSEDKSDLEEGESRSSAIRDDKGSLGSDEDSSNEDLSAERDVQEVTLHSDKVLAKVETMMLDDVDEDDTENGIDQVDQVVTPSSFFYGGRGATYGSLLTQGQLYFRSWNELQAQMLPKELTKADLIEPVEKPYVPIQPAKIQRDEFHSAIPSLDQDIPEKSDWILENDEFVSITLHNLPFLDATSFLAPESRLDDGLMYLLLIRKGATKNNLLKFMIEMEKGKHTKIPNVEIIPVTAFRLIPETRNNNSNSPEAEGHLTIDGENITVGPIQAQILPSTAKIFVK